MGEDAICIIQDYIDKNLFGPCSSWDKKYFDERSYSQWIANEILLKIKEEPKVPALMLIQEIIDKLDKWSCLKDNELWDRSYLLSTAKETAEDIACLFL